MNHASISTESLLTFAKTLEGQVITSRAGRSQFTLRVIDDDLEFTPVSSGTPRFHQYRYVQKALDQFNKSRSFTLQEYRDNGIVNATYFLTIVDLYLNSHNHDSCQPA